ncbi:hypothetical protein HYY75_04050, partial [bacterium]|nr:hypothetical protein [bacterium]
MANKILPARLKHFPLAGLIMLMLFTLFGCTTGVRKDPGLTDFEAPNIPLNIVGIGK